LDQTSDDLIIVPKEFGFDILKPEENRNPILVHEVRFWSIKNRFLLWFMNFDPNFKTLMKNKDR